jgi:hypothetical protein
VNNILSQESSASSRKHQLAKSDGAASESSFAFRMKSRGGDNLVESSMSMTDTQAKLNRLQQSMNNLSQLGGSMMRSKLSLNSSVKHSLHFTRIRTMSSVVEPTPTGELQESAMFI